jgi:hypothetical protein
LAPIAFPVISADAHDVHAFLHGPGHDETEGMHSVHQDGLVEEMIDPAASLDAATTALPKDRKFNATFES